MQLLVSCSVVSMGSVLHGHGGHGGLLSYSYSYSYSRLGLQNSGIVSCLSVAAAAARGGLGLRWQVLEQVDEELSKGDERAALSLVKDLQGKPDGLRCFGAARQVSFNGGVSGLLLDTIGHTFSQKYHTRVIQVHTDQLGCFEEGRSLNVQAGAAFVDFEFTEEINTGKLSAAMLNRFSCIALAGVATEYLLFGYAEGGLADISKLDILLKSLGFTQKKADSQVRWAVLNTLLILRRHEDTRAKLAEALSEGRSVGGCINIIEETIDDDDI